MTGNRVSIAGLLGLVAVTACCLAAMRSASPWWIMLGTTIGLGLLLSAVLGVFFLRDDSRAFASGFALFGLVYLVLVNWDWIGGQVGRDLLAGLSHAVETYVFPPLPKSPNYFGFESHQQRQFRIGNFVQITRLSFSIFFGLAGGLIARAMAAGSRRVSRPGASNE